MKTNEFNHLLDNYHRHLRADNENDSRVVSILAKNQDAVVFNCTDSVLVFYDKKDDN